MDAISTAGRVVLGLACAAFVLSSRAAEPAPSFSKQVQPILDANCVACHQSASAQQGLVLETELAYGNLSKSSSEIPAMKLVQPGSAEESYLYRKLAGTHLDVGGRGVRMPLGSALANEDIDAIRRWIKAGAKND